MSVCEEWIVYFLYPLFYAETDTPILLGDGAVFGAGGKVHICEITAEPGIQGCLIARQKTYKNIWQRHLWVSFRIRETNNERAQKLQFVLHTVYICSSNQVSFVSCGCIWKHIGDKIQGVCNEKAFQ